MAELEHFWLPILLVALGVLNKDIVLVGFPVDCYPIVGLAIRLIISFSCSLNLNSIIVSDYLVILVSRMVVILIKLDDRGIFGICPVHGLGLRLSLFLDLFGLLVSFRLLLFLIRRAMLGKLVSHLSLIFLG